MSALRTILVGRAVWFGLIPGPQGCLAEHVRVRPRRSEGESSAVLGACWRLDPSPKKTRLSVSKTAVSEPARTIER